MKSKRLKTTLYESSDGFLYKFARRKDSLDYQNRAGLEDGLYESFDDARSAAIKENEDAIKILLERIKYLKEITAIRVNEISDPYL